MVTKRSILFLVLFGGGALAWGCSGETIGQPPGETGGVSGASGGASGTGGTVPGIDPCIDACVYVMACFGESDAECTQTCSDVDGMSEAGAQAVANCLRELTCAQVEAGLEVVECAELADTVDSGSTDPGADPCVAACRHVAVCLDASPGDCTETCAETDGLTEAEARAAAVCISALTCAEIQDPSGAALLECI